MNGQSNSELSCGAQSVTFSASGVNNATSYEWNTSSLTNAGWSVVSQSTTSLTMTSSSNSGGTLTWKAKRDCKEEVRSFAVTRPAPGSGAFISGDNSICSGSKEYTVTNLPSGASITGWSHQYLSGNCTTCNPITLTPSGSGQSFISATISDNCGTATKSRIVRVGTYSQSEMALSINGGSNTFCTNQQVQFSCTMLSNSSSDYQWQVYYPSGYSGSYDRNTYFFSTFSAGSGSATVRVQNVCGWPSMPAAYNFNVNSCGGFRYRASPNPTKDQLTVETIDETGKLISLQDAGPNQAEFTYQLVNEKGKIFREGTSRNWKVETNVKGIPKGIYFLKVTNGTDKDQQQIAIEE
jgi:hypothetical protein